MGFLALLVVAAMPVLEFLLVGMVGAVLATGYFNILTPDARKETNKVKNENIICKYNASSDSSHIVCVDI